MAILTRTFTCRHRHVHICGNYSSITTSIIIIIVIITITTTTTSLLLIS